MRHSLRYVNAEPITDPLLVLDLLYHDYFECHDERKLQLPRTTNWHDPYVWIYKNRKHYYFKVSANAVESLVRNSWVAGTQHWGYTDRFELSLSPQGKTYMLEVYKALGIPYDQKFARRLRTEDWMKAHADPQHH